MQVWVRTRGLLGEKGRSTHRLVDRAEEAVGPSLVAAGRLELLRIWEDLVLGACGGQGRVGGLRLERHPPVPN